jgi:DNA-binding HxlR family transcriptional regulator
VLPRVEYAITDFGKTLIPLLNALYDWGAIYLGVDEASPHHCQARAGKTKK